MSQEVTLLVDVAQRLGEPRTLVLCLMCFVVIYFMRVWVALLCELAAICLTCLSIVYLLRFFLHVYALYT